ncbi:hypothetical protein [Rhodococcus wratislaviensis]|uniref:hypothetical protein n=1 Tax=Rhodococcus wratislaviensis TaxID=44752 RepID=UPI003669E405
MTANPDTVGTHSSAATSNTVGAVWIRSSMFEPVRAGVVMTYGSADGTRLVSDGSGWLPEGRMPEGATPGKTTGSFVQIA